LQASYKRETCEKGFDALLFERINIEISLRIRVTTSCRCQRVRFRRQ